MCRWVSETYAGDNAKANEFLFRRVDLEGVVSAHILAGERASGVGFRRYVISATTPFLPEDLRELREDAPVVVRRRVPEYQAEYERRGWKMFPSIDRVYVNDRARHDLGWRPRYDFAYICRPTCRRGMACGARWHCSSGQGYHAKRLDGGRYPFE